MKEYPRLEGVARAAVFGVIVFGAASVSCTGEIAGSSPLRGRVTDDAGFARFSDGGSLDDGGSLPRVDAGLPPGNPVPPPVPPPGPPVVPGELHVFFNSSEAGCDGSDPDILFCDDFEDGFWMRENAISSSPTKENKGWVGGAFDNLPWDTNDMGRCGNRGVGGTNCAVTSGPFLGAMQDIQSPWHGLSTAVEEVYFRYYLQLQPGAVMGTLRKMLSFQPHPPGAGNSAYFGGVTWSGQEINFWGQHTPPLGAYQLGWLDQNAADGPFAQHQDPAIGHWVYVEVRIKLNTPGASDGIYELWMDDCGTDGLGCTGPGTKRASWTNVKLRDSASDLIRTVWVLNSYSWWTGDPNAVRGAGEIHYDQMIASKRRIGPMP